ncbi:MAG: type II toxin-antitoxin system VapC family toxin [Bacteroidota bacterium]|nr:type II toxin-antitoxin system VapC family toxin [Bacteroidota bacterium]
MNGNKLLLDTNIILYILDGDNFLSDYLSNKILYTSIICEIELLGYKSLTTKEISGIESFLNKFRIISVDQSIKKLTIQLRRAYSIKIPDAIIAATSIELGIPLVTADIGFKNIVELNIDLYNQTS